MLSEVALFDDNGNIIKEKVLTLRNRLISQLKSEITTYRKSSVRKSSIRKSKRKSSIRKSKRKLISSR